eukprot:755775-Hanusia_phi.AAC.2
MYMYTSYPPQNRKVVACFCVGDECWRGAGGTRKGGGWKEGEEEREGKGRGGGGGEGGRGSETGGDFTGNLVRDRRNLDQSCGDLTWVRSLQAHEGVRSAESGGLWDR